MLRSNSLLQSVVEIFLSSFELETYKLDMQGIKNSEDQWGLWIKIVGKAERQFLDHESIIYVFSFDFMGKLFNSLPHCYLKWL